MTMLKSTAKTLARFAVGIAAVTCFTVIYAHQPPVNLLGFFLHTPIEFLWPIIVVDIAAFTIAMVARVEQLSSIVRCYVYAAVGYAVGIFLVRNGHDFALAVPFYAPLIGWAIAVIQNHFGPKIWSLLVNASRFTHAKAPGAN